jgi:Peptidase M10 serralysin C terminal
MAAPVVTTQDTTILLGTTVLLTDLFSFSDADGDPPTRIRFRDNNNNTDSGYLTFNGVVQPPNTVLTYNWADRHLLVYRSGTVISKERLEISVEAGGEWSSFSSFLMYTVKENLNLPLVTAAARTVVQSEVINLAQSISFSDPDGYPVAQWQVRDTNAGAFSGELVLNGSTLTAGVWHTVSINDFPNLSFKAAFSAPLNDTIEVRGFDGASWSFVTPFVVSTAQNINRPVVIPSEFVMPVDQVVSLSSLFDVSDADNNTIKVYRFWDATPHSWSGAIRINGVEQPTTSFVQINAADMANADWRSSRRPFVEQLRVQVYDGNHWSEIQTVRVRTDAKPIIRVGSVGGGGYTVSTHLVNYPIAPIITKLDTGPVFTSYQVYDSAGDARTGNFRVGASTLAPNTIHTFSPIELQNLQFKTGVYEQRSVDEIYVRAFNGTFWSDWTRHTFFTEPEYVSSLAQLGRWTDVPGIPTVGGRLKMSFSFMDVPHSGVPDTGPEFARPWDPMRQQLRDGFARMSEIIPVDFEEVPDSRFHARTGGTGGDIAIGTYCEVDSGVAAYATPPGPGDGNSVIMFNRFYMGGPLADPPYRPEDPCPSAPIPFDEWYQTTSNHNIFMHEFGHVMGLKHPFDGQPKLPVVTDNSSFSVMSYSNSPSGLSHRAQAVYDIAALHSYYGASSFNSTNTVYNTAYWDNPWYTGGWSLLLDSIHDTGGIDTIDASDQFGAVRIDLRQGRFSSIGGNNNNVSISFGTVIENAFGGDGFDVITGNDANNILRGNVGNDTIDGKGGGDFSFGGAGNDTYAYAMGAGRLTINEENGAGRDILRAGLFLGLDNFTSDLSFTRTGNDLLIDFALDNSVSRGSVNIVNQAFGKSRIETFNLMGMDVDLKFLFENVTTSKQKFSVTAVNGQYGLLVAPA